MKPMNETGCNYSVIRFRPYRSLGEFVNVGVVAFCQQHDYFDFKLTSHCNRRIRNFFPKLDPYILSSGLDYIKRCLSASKRENKVKTSSQFAAIFKPKEGLLYYSEQAWTVVDLDKRDLNTALNDLFKEYVESNDIQLY